MKYYHYLKACEIQRSQGVTDVTSWIDCVCQLLLKNNGIIKGVFLFVRCDEIDGNINFIPNKVSFYLCRFRKYRYHIIAYHEEVDYDQPLYADIRDAKLTRIYLYHTVPDKLKRNLERQFQAKKCQILSINDLAPRTPVLTARQSLWAQIFKRILDRRYLFFLALFVVTVLVIAGLKNRCSRVESIPPQKFPKIEGTYYIKGNDLKEGYAAEIKLSQDNSQDSYFLYIYSDYSTPQFALTYDQNTGFITSSELGEGKVTTNNNSNIIIIKFKEWTLSK